MPALRKRNLAKIVHAGMNSLTGRFCSGFRRPASVFRQTVHRGGPDPRLKV